MIDKQILIRDMTEYEPIINKILFVFEDAELSIVEGLGLLDIIRDELHNMRYQDD